MYFTYALYFTYRREAQQIGRWGGPKPCDPTTWGCLAHGPHRKLVHDVATTTVVHMRTMTSTIKCCAAVLGLLLRRPSNFASSTTHSHRYADRLLAPPACTLLSALALTPVCLCPCTLLDGAQRFTCQACARSTERGIPSRSDITPRCEHTWGAACLHTSVQSASSFTLTEQLLLTEEIHTRVVSCFVI